MLGNALPSVNVE